MPLDCTLGTFFILDISYEAIVVKSQLSLQLAFPCNPLSPGVEVCQRRIPAERTGEMQQLGEGKFPDILLEVSPLKHLSTCFTFRAQAAPFTPHNCSAIAATTHL